MALGLQKSLNHFQFERSVDWRVGFPNLLKMNEKLKDILFDGKWCFAKSVVFPVSLIDVVEDSGLKGFYTSNIVIPSLTVELYTDGRGIIETALRAWNAASFTTDGFMPSMTSENFSIQSIKVCRVSPLRESDVLSAMQDMGDGTIIETDIIEQYEFKGYLAKIPDYTGQNSASIRTLTLNFKLVSQVYSRMETDLKILDDRTADGDIAMVDAQLEHLKKQLADMAAEEAAEGAALVNTKKTEAYAQSKMGLDRGAKG